jgi:hypothetical protein
MILLGSGRGGDPVIDTVFVVGEVVGTNTRWTSRSICPSTTPSTPGRSSRSAPYEPEYFTAPYTLYRGATVSDPVDPMHSFVPCLLRDDDQPRFPRPAVDLPGVVNPSQPAGPIKTPPEAP